MVKSIDMAPILLVSFSLSGRFYAFLSYFKYTLRIKKSKLRWRTPLQGGCPTITDSNKKTTKRGRLGPLNRKRRNSVITSGNCRTACKLAGYSTEIKEIVFTR